MIAPGGTKYGERSVSDSPSGSLAPPAIYLARRIPGVLERRGRVVSGRVRLAAPRARHWGNSIVFLNAKRRSINLFHGEQKLEGGSQLIQNAQASKTQVWRGRNIRQDNKQHAASGCCASTSLPLKP